MSNIVSHNLVFASTHPAEQASVSTVIPITTSQNTHSMITKSKNGIHEPKNPIILSVLHESETVPEVEPVHFSQASPHLVWQKAIQEEYEALIKQGTWDLVPAPSQANVIGCQWIYKIKRNSDGSVARYKARLVANGNQQYEGIDFTETSRPVVKQPTIRVVLSLALHYNWDTRQLDVSNAFLHGIIEEEAYMRQPLGFKDKDHPQYVCKLKKALYGLRQAPRAWYSVFSGFLLQQGFSNSPADVSLFVLKKDQDVTLVLV